MIKEREIGLIELGERLRSAREYLGYSQGDVAKHLGISRPSVTHWEQGNRRIDALTLGKLAKLYQRPVGSLLNEEKDATALVSGIIAIAPKEDQDEIIRFAQFLRWRKRSKAEHG